MLKTLTVASQQLPNETHDAYLRFLTYLHLGPMRTIETAMQIQGQHNDGGTSVTTRDWGIRWDIYFADCHSYAWDERAQVWDLAVSVDILSSCLANDVDGAAGRVLGLAFDFANMGTSSWCGIMEMISIYANFRVGDATKKLMHTQSKHRNMVDQDNSGDEDTGIPF